MSEFEFQLNYFEMALKEKTEINNFENVLNKDGYFLDGRYLKKVHSVLIFKEKYNPSEIVLENILIYLEDLIERFKKYQSFYCVVKMFFIQLKLLFSQVCFENKTTLDSLNYLNFVFLYNFIIDSFDKEAIIIVSGFYFKNKNINVNSYDIDYLNFLNKGIKKIHFKTITDEKIIEKFDYSDFYDNYLSFFRNRFVHYPEVVFFKNINENIEYYSQLVNYDNFFSFEFSSIDFKEIIIFALLYKIIFLKKIENFIQNYN